MLYAMLIEEHLDEKKVILTDHNRDYTYMQLHKRALSILTCMCQHGVSVGDRVIIKNSNDGETAVAVLACLAGGIIFVLASGFCSEEELEYMKKDCSASMILDVEKTKDCERIELEAIRERKGWISKSAGAYILYTSGTEGEKKGVFACQKQIIFCCNSILSRLRYRESDRVLCSLPLEFDYGLYQIFLSLLSKVRLFLVDTGMIQMIPNWLHKWRISIFPTLPSVVNILLKMNYMNREQLPCLRKVTFTGEYLSVDEIKAIKTVLPFTEIIPMYGVTECKRVAVMPEGREDKVMAGSCGLPLDGVTVYLEDEATNGEGKLVVEGPNVMEGYWQGEEGGFKTNSVTSVKTYHTGDLMSIDEEGFLYFRGRCKGLIKSRGYRISEMEVERLIWKTKGIIECAVIGVPDAICGEKIGICVYTHSKKIRRSIDKTMSQNSTYRNSYNIYMMTELLPRNSNGKIDKEKLRRMVYEREKYVSGK
ncbi:class I adenylate-forming enzyme family protein [Lachnospiraceae bacterium 50-23]